MLVPIRPGGSRPPLFLVHPVGGDVLAYAELARRLEGEQPVYGLRSRGLAAGEEAVGTVEEMAADYLRAVRGVQPAGPYRLGGWSMGGVVAYEMARQLEAAGERAETLVLIDAQVPALHGRTLPADAATRVRIFARDLGLPEEASGGETIGEVLEGARAAGWVPAELTAEGVGRLYGVFETNLGALYAYRPGRYGGRVTLLRAAEHDSAETASAGWERVAAGGVEVRAVGGSHFTLVREPHVAGLALELDRCLRPARRELEGVPGRPPAHGVTR